MKPWVISSTHPEPITTEGRDPATAAILDLCRRYSALAPMDFSNSDAAMEDAGTMLEATRAIIAALKQVTNESTSRSSLEIYAPYVRLGMAMARADGEIASAEVRFIIDFMMKNLDLPQGDTPALKLMMKEPVPTNLGPLVDAAIELGADRDAGCSVLMSLLTAVAQADDVVRREEVQFLRTVSKLVGWNNTQFESFAKQHRLPLSDPWQVLGVSPTASWAEVRTAYKEKMKKYHPDKMAQMPPEFLMLAHEKCTEFNASLEAIKAHLGA